tara:strand:+ start:67 stop:243 length:177 start_codon:yes stop_codon:yes gene_type:complete
MFNPVRDIALFLQPCLPASEGWQAASVPMAMVVCAAVVIAGCAGVVWAAQKIGEMACK